MLENCLRPLSLLSISENEDCDQNGLDTKRVFCDKVRALVPVKTTIRLGCTKPGDNPTRRMSTLVNRIFLLFIFCGKVRSDKGWMMLGSHGT